MTKFLQRAFTEASKLPEEAQDEVAAQLLGELADQAKWDATFAASADVLERLASEALEEYLAGRTEELQDHSYLRQKIEHGLEEVEAGRTLSEEEFDRRMEKWLGSKVDRRADGSDDELA